MRLSARLTSAIGNSLASPLIGFADLFRSRIERWRMSHLMNKLRWAPR
jgi:hypothetical protein